MAVARVASTRVAALSSQTSVTTGTVTVQVGDIMVAWGLMMRGDALVAPITVADGFSGGAYTKQVEVAVSSAVPYAAIWTKTMTVAGSAGLTFNRGAGASTDWTVGFVVFRGATGVGASASNHVNGAAPSVDMTLQGANSAVIQVDSDTIGIDTNVASDYTPTTLTWTLVASMPRVQAATYAFYAATTDDAGAAGTKTFGMGYPGGQNYALAVLELTAGASGPNVAVELWENGAFVQTLQAATALTAEDVLSLRWDASALADPSGAGVELRIVGDTATLDVGAIEWLDLYSVTAGQQALAGASHSVSTASGDLTVSHPLAGASDGSSTVVVALSVVSGFTEAWGMVLI